MIVFTLPGSCCATITTVIRDQVGLINFPTVIGLSFLAGGIGNLISVQVFGKHHVKLHLYITIIVKLGLKGRPGIITTIDAESNTYQHRNIT